MDLFMVSPKTVKSNGVWKSEKLRREPGEARSTLTDCGYTGPSSTGPRRHLAAMRMVSGRQRLHRNPILRNVVRDDFLHPWSTLKEVTVVMAPMIVTVPA